MKALAFALLMTISLGLAAQDGQAPQPPTLTHSPHSGEGWTTNFQEAYAESNESGKPIFAFFTGSDWCGWCKRLQANVLQKPAFKEWAEDKVVLLELDFPRRSRLPQDLAVQNQNLQRALKITGYPTIWIMTVSMNEANSGFNLNTLGRLGYPSGAVPGQEEVKFIQNAEGALAKLAPSTN